MSKMKLSDLLKKYKFNQKDLADYTGINKNTISKYANNTFEKVDKVHIDLLCDIFRCTPNDLFELEPVQQKMFPPSEISNWIDAFKPNNVKQEENKKTLLSEDTFVVIDKLKKKNNNTINSTHIYPSEEDYDMEQMQIRFEREYKLSNNLFLIINNIIYNADISKFTDNLISDIENYKNMTNSIEASKFMLVYRVLYIVIVQQLKNKQLLEFIVKIKKIYSISPFFSTIEDEELQSLIKESEELLNKLNIKQKD